MNKTKKHPATIVLLLFFAAVFTGCGQREDTNAADENRENSISVRNIAASESAENQEPASHEESAEGEADLTENTDESVETSELEVCFGDEGEPFLLHLYDNDTAAAIAGHVGTADWRLPIYHYDDYDNWESMQYYDVPDRYEIPSNAETVTSVKGGEVYYSEPNRIVLFYHDAEISAEYTRVGYFDYTEEFAEAVENNPVLEGWGNKIVLIRSAD